MRRIKRILVAIKDPSSRSLPGVAKAAQLAQSLGADMELFHGISTPLYVDGYADSMSLPEIEKSIRSRSLQQLERIAGRLRKTGLTVSVAAEWDFPVYESVVRRAIRIKADLIVAQVHAHAHVLPGLLQLTDWELLRTSPVPVLVVKTTGTYRRPVILAAVDPAHAFAKPAKLDEEVLQAGTTVARALHGSLHAVHAYMPLPLASTSRGVASQRALQRALAQTKAAAARIFDRTVRSAGIPKQQRHLVARHPIDAIEDTARRTHSAIVVMGAISRSGLKRFFFGNTAEAVLDSLTCDLLIVKPVNFVSRVPKRVRGVRFAAVPFSPLY